MSFGSPYFTLPKFKYIKPRTLDEAIEILSNNGEDARLMAGGVGLLNFMKERLAEPSIVIDLKGIKELHKLEYDDSLKIGATVTMNELLSFAPVKREYYGLYQAVSMLSDHNLRNRSTLVGDLCEALPWVDSPPPLIAYDAFLNVANRKGIRKVQVKDFIKGMAQIDLASDEIVTSIEIPQARNKVARFYKFATGTEFAIVSLAVLRDVERNTLSLVFGGVSELPYCPEELTYLYSGSSSLSDFLNKAVSFLRKSFTPMDDTLASSTYRLNLMEKLMVKGVKEVFHVMKEQN